MKKRLLLLGTIFVFFGFVTRAQVYEMYYQGFETGETQKFSITPSSSLAYSTEVVSSGSRAMRVMQSQSEDVEIILDTVDFSQNTSLTYVAFEFDHIVNISTPAADLVRLYVKRANESSWTQLNSQYYDQTGSYSTQFVSISNFNVNSYANGFWTGEANNNKWKHERFNLNTFLGTDVATANRKLVFRIVVKKPSSGATVSASESWWVDNIRIRASQNQMVKPKVSMFSYPDGGAYPNSRGANIILDARTTVSQGINQDSVYLYYTVGENGVPVRKNMTYKGSVTAKDGTTWDRFIARLPFEGYDTTMKFYCVVKDATTNFNEATYPDAANSWVTYHYVRGVDQPGLQTSGFTGTSTSQYVPFTQYARNRSEWVYDSALLAEAGYGPGSITALKFTMGANTTGSSRTNFQFRMKNVPTDYEVGTVRDWTTDYMQIVYDSTLTIPALSNGDEFTVTLKDTFYYAGGDIVMQAIYNNATDPSSATIKMIAAPAELKTKAVINGQSSGTGNDNPFNATSYFNRAQDLQSVRPAIVMTQKANMPLYYDMGLSHIVFPTYETPIMSVPSHIDVMLHNYGAMTVNGVRISYTIDDTIPGYFDWTGAMGGGDSAVVTVTSTVNLPAGYHYVRAWVEDTLSIGSNHIRDHEPYNDTTMVEFIVCEGPLSGVRQIGGTDADYNTIEEFLFSLSRCGIDDSLVVRLAPGQYPAFVMPTVSGHTEQHYIVYESLDPNNKAVLYADETTESPYVVDITAVGNMRFRNLRFERREGLLTAMIGFGANSDNCTIEGCEFEDIKEQPTVAERIPALVATNNSDNVTIVGNTFVGGTIGVSVEGQSTLALSNDVMVIRNTFRNQQNNAVRVENMNNIVIDHNEMYDVMGNQGYVVQMLQCYGEIALTANKVYTSHGAGGIGLNGLHGTESQPAIVANNMVVCNDDGTATTMNSPLNVISTEWTDVVYNSVKMNAPTRNNIAAAIFGGGVLSDSRFVNNIVASYDVTNYALHYMPGTQTGNTVSNNVYYATGASLNRRQGVVMHTIDEWREAVPEDTISIMAEPGYLNGSLVDLRTYNRTIKGVGRPIETVLVDMFDSVRNDTATCPGAFEFVALFYDFEPQALISPMAYDCNMPDEVEMVVRIRNTGVREYNNDGTVQLALVYSINNGATHTISISDTIPAEDTVSIRTGEILNLPPNGLLDATYNMRMWVECASDPNQTNDTSLFTVVSRYQANAPDDVVDTIDYMQSSTLWVTEGVDMWSVYESESAPKVPSEVYWYRSIDDEEPISKGLSFVTDQLREDTIFYIKQHREVPIVRITKVMVKGNNAIGEGTRPSWMAANTQVAVQLTNIGDDTAYLQGDTLRCISTTNTYNNKFAKFGDVRIAPGQSIVVQFNQGTSNDNTVYTGGTNSRITPTITTPLAFIYRSGGKAVDAVPMNGMTSATRWADEGVPTYVWNDTSMTIATTNPAGIVRKSFTGTLADWDAVTYGYLLDMGENKSSWQKYVDNGCPGGISTARVIIRNPPMADVELTAQPLPTGCGLGDEELKVAIHNYGNLDIEGLELNYTLGGDDTVRETLTQPVAAHGDSLYTFVTPLDLSFDRDSNVNITIWATALLNDPMQDNDTTRVSTVSLYTSEAPQLPDTIVAVYGRKNTIAFAVPEGRMPVWYNYDMVPTDTGFVYTTDILYTEGLLGMSYVVAKADTGVIGTGAGMTTKLEYPSPYQPSKKYVKQQFIYTKAEVEALGIGQGGITDIAFHLDSINAWGDSILFRNYTISFGESESATFANTSSWKTTAPYYRRDSLYITRENIGEWVWHRLDRIYMWDGESNIVVQVVFENDTMVESGVQTTFTQISNTTLYKADNTELSPSTAEYVNNGTRGAKRPNIQLAGQTFGCNGPVTTMMVVLDSVPDYDVTVNWIGGIDTVDYNSCDEVSPQVVVRNLGKNNVEGYQLRYYVDADTIPDTNFVTGTIGQGEIDTVQLFSRIFSPGRHVVRVEVYAEGDSVVNNNNASVVLTARFCAGSYTIGADSVSHFHSVVEAVDTLNTVGMIGPIIFVIDSGVYEGCVVLEDVYKTNPGNGITFVGTKDSAAVVIVGNTNATTNSVFTVNRVDNVQLRNLCLVSRPVGNEKNGNVLTFDSCSDVMINNCIVRVKGGLYDNKASGIVFRNGGRNIIVSENQIDSGYCGITTVMSDNRYENLLFYDNRFNNFQARGLEVNGVTLLRVQNNELRAGADADGRGMVGLSLMNVDSTFMVTKNKIYLLDAHTGSKGGIYINNVTCSGLYNGYVTNNMISTSGTGTAGLSGANVPKNPSGIYVDGNTSYVNFYFNTVRTYAGASQTATRSFCVNSGPTTLQVMSNLLTNFSQSHAYYVTDGNSVIASDNNAYYSTASNKLAYWGAEKATLTALQTANMKDEYSVVEEPYFTSQEDLHLLMTNFCGKAQYNTDVMDDIDGNSRPQMPAPTIGAHEMERLDHNMTVVRIIEPLMPANIKNPLDVETDSVKVKAVFYNNGISSESGISWYAYIDGHRSATQTVTRLLGDFDPTEMKTDSVMMPTTFGIIDTQMVRVVLIASGDEDTADNNLTAPVYLAPAYDFEVTKIQSSTSGCNNRNAEMTLTVKNVGFKDISVGTTIQIGYDLNAYYPSYINSNPDSNRISISTLTPMVTESYTFDAQLNKNMTKAIVFNTHANLYPTGHSKNIKVRVRGWTHYQYDIKADNDTTGAATSASPVVDSYFTPASPVGHDTTFSYASWGAVRAEQENQRPIRWYRDSTDATPFYTGTGSGAALYNSSCLWASTPMYFHDSTYYLMCYSDKNCASSFSPVHVHLGQIQGRDVSVQSVIAPIGNRVYMENDTVKVRIANYGTQSVSNIPVTYELRKGANSVPIQQETQICSANLSSGQTYVFTFDSLLHFSQPTTAGTYFLRVWTDLATDLNRMNDTIRMVNKLRSTNENNTELDYQFKTLAETTYPSCGIGDASKMDIVRVSFNEIDIDMPALGRKYNNLGVFTSPEVPVLHVQRGTTDSIFITINNPSDPYAIERGKVAVYIDFNRNGSFSDSTDIVVPATNVYNNSTLASEIVIPNTASLGYMKMRVCASTFETNPTASMSNQDGHMIDFLLFVDERANPSDLALTQIVAPRNYLVRNDNPVTVSFRMANRGSQTISSAEIFYRFDSEVEDTANLNMGSIQWTGNLAPGTSTVVELPEHVFDFGTTTLHIWHSLADDAVRRNDTLQFEYHRFHVITLELDDNFDSLHYWYAPVGYNDYTHNFWELGTPNKSKISGTKSEPNAWVTDLENSIVTGKRGNVSYLYSPIINIANIKPDSISFWMRRNLTNNSYLRLEYYDYQGNWVNAASDTSNPDTWYNHVDDKTGVKDFNGSDASTSTDYKRYSFSSREISGNFQELSQFRFAYYVPQGTADNSSYGEGAAIDNFRIARAQRRYDVGVVEIIEPESIKYGETVYPKVAVKNFGLDTINEVRVGFTTFGANLARLSTFIHDLAPQAVDTFQMLSPIIITSNFPDSIRIAAFTIRSDDAYKDNDTVVRDYFILPLDKDVEASAIIEPLDRVIAGDSLQVTMRIRNFGADDLYRVHLSYDVSGHNRVDEDVDIVALLGHPLAAREYFNYTFHQKFRAMMGVMNVTGIAKSDTNEYLFNDTISKRINGMSAITDLAAAAIILDTIDYGYIQVELAIENRGARGANDFLVGYYIDGNEDNAVIETYHTYMPLPALNTGYHVFQSTLPPRPQPYDSITAFVRIIDDNDPSNDTTSEFGIKNFDLQALMVLVEENSNPDCRVFIKVRNNGNMSTVGRNVHCEAVVDGNQLVFDGPRRIDPGNDVLIQFSRKVPKNPQRNYAGSGQVIVPGDSNPANDQTSDVRVTNYVDGVPTVNAGQYSLGQNYPNPFSGLTTIPFSLPEAALVQFFVMDVSGHVVYSSEGFYPAGDASISLDMSTFPAGIYYYGIQTLQGRQMRKLILR